MEHRGEWYRSVSAPNEMPWAVPEATEVVRQTAKMLDDFKEALLILREVSGEAKRQRDRLVAAIGEMRRYVVTNLRVHTGALRTRMR